MVDKVAPRRADYAWFRPVTSRWMDNDVFGHVNNAHYYSYFDTVINRYLIERGGLDIHASPVVHVFVDRGAGRPVEIPEPIRRALEAIAR